MDSKTFSLLLKRLVRNTTSKLIEKSHKYPNKNSVFLPDLEKRMQNNVAEKKRVEEEMSKFHNQMAQDKKGELDKMYPNISNPNTGKNNEFLIKTHSFEGSKSLYQQKAQGKTKMEEVKEKFDEMKLEDEKTQ